MSLYESVFIIRQELSVAAAVKIADRYAGTIDKEGGKIVKRENWGLLNLAYRIRKNRKGHFFLFNIDGPSKAVQEMERGMKLDTDTLRCLTTRIDAVSTDQSPIMHRPMEDDKPGYRRSDDRPERRDMPQNRGDSRTRGEDGTHAHGTHTRPDTHARSDRGDNADGAKEETTPPANKEDPRT